MPIGPLVPHRSVPDACYCTNNTYNSTSNLLTSIDDTVGTADYSFTYDDYGNVTNNGNQGFTYNLAGNLISSTSPALSYKYDGHKRRVQKTEAGQTSYTVYGSNGKLLHKLKGGVATHYVYAGSLLIAELNGTTVNYLHTDLLGSPIKGDNGSSYAEHYRPWGEKKDHPTQLADDVGYTGHQSDVATGLTYMQARYYDPVVGRFMAVDPVQFIASKPMSFGRFLYVNDNPYKYTDPDGEFLDTFLDIAFVIVDVAILAHDELTNGGANRAENLMALGADTAGAFVPFATGGGVAVRAGRAADNVVDAARGADNVPNGRVNSAGQPINERGQFVSGAGGESAATARGREAHDALAAKVDAKDGWQSNPRIVDRDGNVHIPDALTPSGRPIELKPNTPSGIAQGRRQLRRYEQVTGRRGRLLLYDVD